MFTLLAPYFNTNSKEFALLQKIHDLWARGTKLRLFDGNPTTAVVAATSNAPLYCPVSPQN
jgi:hypothetical protein